MILLSKFSSVRTRTCTFCRHDVRSYVNCLNDTHNSQNEIVAIKNTIMFYTIVLLAQLLYKIEESYVAIELVFKVTYVL